MLVGHPLYTQATVIKNEILLTYLSSSLLDILKLNNRLWGKWAQSAPPPPKGDSVGMPLLRICLKTKPCKLSWPPAGQS
jgi:hypothetical protein